MEEATQSVIFEFQSRELRRTELCTTAKDAAQRKTSCIHGIRVVRNHLTYVVSHTSKLSVGSALAVGGEDQPITQSTAGFPASVHVLRYEAQEQAKEEQASLLAELQPAGKHMMSWTWIPTSRE